MPGKARYANVTSTLALVVALGGTGAYAANTIGSSDIRDGSIRHDDIGRSQVRTENIARGAVRNIDLGNNSITTFKVKNGSLRARDFRKGELPAGAAGAPGPQGPAGPAGPQGAAGTARAYAGVKPLEGGGQAFTGTPRGFDGVTRPSGQPTGVYCLTPSAGVNVVEAAPVATPDFFWSGSDLINYLVYPSSQAILCPKSTLEVRTFRFTSTTNAALSNAVGFSVILP